MAPRQSDTESSSRKYDQEGYEAFKDAVLSSVAAELAAAGRLSSLDHLLQLHLYTLMPSLLEVLASLPETMPVAEYRHLLRVSR